MTNELTCQIVRTNDKTHRGKQAFDYFEGISAESAGAQALCMHMLKVPPGGRAKAHFHESHETAIYVLSGSANMWYGHQLEHHMTVGAGEYLYIPAGMPHLPYNPSETETAVAIVARTDPNANENVTLCPELDELRAND